MVSLQIDKKIKKINMKDLHPTALTIWESKQIQIKTIEDSHSLQDKDQTLSIEDLMRKFEIIIWEIFQNPFLKEIITKINP